ncbi:MAG: hypothetical protein ACOC4G_05420 [Bacillota bacterium]
MKSKNDRVILRELAKKVAEIAELPEMDKKRQEWKKHNALNRVRPMMLVFPEGSWRELLPEEVLECKEKKARKIEWELRRRLYKYNNFQDDTPVEKNWIVKKNISNTGWGVEPKKIESTQPTGSWGFDPVINDESDLDKMTYPEIKYNEDTTLEELNQMQELFGDILEVKLKGIDHISFHLMNIYCKLRGLEQIMWDMYDNPDMLHKAMSILEKGHQNMIEQYRQQNLFSLNNDETYHSSGGVGYTDELPQSDFNPDKVRPEDMWASAEAQEMAQVSPEMHAEFILPYEKRLLKPFGLNGYGCCEDLTHKLDEVFTIPGIRRISISPWADVEVCAKKLQDNYIYSWKPDPSHLVGNFSEDKVEKYVSKTLECTRDSIIEIILKDTHTCENKPERFNKWTEVVRHLIDKMD